MLTCCVAVPVIHCWIWLWMQLHRSVRGAGYWLAVV